MRFSRPGSSSIAWRARPFDRSRRGEGREAHQRSLEGEIRALMEREAKQRRMTAWLKRIDRLRKQVPPWKPGMPTAVDLVRECREEDRH